jgi:isopenicillin-N epimerase
VIDHVTSPSGLVFPVAQIVAGCRDRGVDVLVDGAHVPGMIALDVEALAPAYYAANLHKWVCAPKGTAILWVSPRHQAEVHPTVISHNLDAGFAREFAWQGTRDIAAWLTAPVAIEFMSGLGWDRVLDHNHRMAVWAHQMLTDRWGVEPVSPLDGSLLGSMAAVRLPGRLADFDGNQLAALQQRLHDQHRIEVPMIPWKPAMLRVSCQVYNRPEEYERLGEVIAEIAAEG